MSNAKEGKKALFKRNSDLRTVFLITVFFTIAVVLYQLISSLITDGALEYPSIVSPSNILNILQQVSAVGIMAMGMTAVMLAGGIDLSVGMMSSLVAIFVAKGVMHWGMPTAVTLILAIMICVALELIMGFIIAWLNVEAFIITLGGMIACQGIALLTSRSQEIALSGQLDPFKFNLMDEIASWFGVDGGFKLLGRKLNLPVYVIIFIIIAVIMWAVLKYTKFGRRIYAVGNNPQAAFLSGINVRRIRLTTYALNGLCVGIGATMLLSRNPTGIITIGQNKEIDVIAAVVIGGVAMSGGKGNVMGAFIGAILMGMITNAMTLMGLQSEWSYFVKGVIIIIAVAGGALSEMAANRRAVREKEQETSPAP